MADKINRLVLVMLIGSVVWPGIVILEISV